MKKKYLLLLPVVCILLALFTGLGFVGTAFLFIFLGLGAGVYYIAILGSKKGQRWELISNPQIVQSAMRQCPQFEAQKQPNNCFGAGGPAQNAT